MHVDSERGFSGGEVQVFLLLEGLRARGLDQILVVPPGSESARIGRERGFRVCELGLRNAFDLWSAGRLASLLRSAALVHLHTGKAAWLGALAARWAGCPAVITRRMDRRVRRGLRTQFAYCTTARRVIAISPAVQRCLIDGGVPADRIVVIWDALDPERSRSRNGRAAVRANLGLRPDQFAVLTLAQLMHRKGLDVLLRAAARVAAPSVVLLLAGDGPEAVPLRQLATALQLGDAVRFLGRRDDPGDLLAACDLFVLPSRAEGLGVAALEALGAARPVIATRVGGLGEVIRDGECGLLVPPDDVDALATAIARLHADAALRARLAAAGPARLDQGFRPHQYVDRHVQLYRDVLDAAPGA